MTTTGGRTSTPVELNARLYLVLGALTALGPLSVDMYLPALPEIGSSLAASAGTIQMTVTAFLAGLVIGPLVIGPVSDSIGRRLPILVSLVGYALVSLLLAMASSVEMMIWLRLAQAACGGTATSLARSMVRDILSGDSLARAMSILTVIMLCAPIVAPFLGGLLLLVSGWRSIFVLLAAISGILFLATWRWLPETLTAERRVPLDLASSTRGYLSIARSPVAMAYAVCSGAAAAVLFAYLAATPFIYIEYHGLDEQWFGAVFGLSVIGAWIAQWVIIRYVERIGYDRLVIFGTVLLVGLAVGLLWTTQTDFGGLAGVVIAAVAVVSLTHLVTPGAIAGVLDGFPHLAGSASGFAFFVRFSLGAAGAGAVGLLNDGTPRSFGVVTMAFSIVALLAAAVAKRAASRTS